MEVYSRVDPRAALLQPNRFNQSKVLTHAMRAVFRILVTAVAVVLAIKVPSFELIAALLGCAFGFLICVIMPVSFHLKMFYEQMTKRQIWLDCMYIAVSAILGIVGTVWEFLPRSWMGLKA
jgi:vesicular inhibitory amino acid transporter